MLCFGPTRYLRQFILALAVFLLTAPAHAADPPKVNVPIDAFFGEFEGETTFLTATGAKKRNLSVSISPVPDAMPGLTGVRLFWTTVHKRDDGTHTQKSHETVFVPADPEGTMFVAVRSSGDAVDTAALDDVQDKKKTDAVAATHLPADPRGTAPYVWGRVKEKTFSVYVVVIRDDGGYEIQIYDRILTAEGLTLVYSRDRGGEHIRLLEAFLKPRKD